MTSDSAIHIAQWFAYAPYGSVIASSNTGATAAARGYIGEFTDMSGLSYPNARYYAAAQSQFISQDPTFWRVKQNLGNPQSLNSYSYAEGNPITKKDPDGCAARDSSSAAFQAQIYAIQAQIYAIQFQLYQIQQSITQSSFSQGVQQGVKVLADPIAGYKTATNPTASPYQRFGNTVGLGIGAIFIAKDVTQIVGGTGLRVIGETLGAKGAKNMTSAERLSSSELLETG